MPQFEIVSDFRMTGDQPEAAAGVFPLNQICTDEAIDHLYSLFQSRVWCAMGLIAKNMELIKKGRPELYERLKKGREEAEKMVSLLT